MNLFRRNPRRLPGKLCDETAGADLMVPQEQRGRWFRTLTPEQIQPYATFASTLGNGVGVPSEPTRRIPVHEVPEPRDDSEYDVPVLNEYECAVIALQVNDPGHEVTTKLIDRRTLEDRYLMVCQRLRQVTADRDRLDAANGLLVAKVHAAEWQLHGVIQERDSLEQANGSLHAINASLRAQLTAALAHDTTGA